MAEQTIPVEAKRAATDAFLASSGHYMKRVTNAVEAALPHLPVSRFAVALLTLWKMEGSECGHGIGLEDDCPEEECPYNEIRPELRAAMKAVK